MENIGSIGIHRTGTVHMRDRKRRALLNGGRSMPLTHRRKGKRRHGAEQQRRDQRHGLGRMHCFPAHSAADCPSSGANSANRSALVSRYCKSPTALPGALTRTTLSLLARVLLSLLKWPTSSMPTPTAMSTAAATAATG